MTFTIGFANGNIAGKTEAKAFAEERGEGEFIEARVSCRFGGQNMRGGTLDVRCHDGIVCNVLVRASFKEASKLELVAGVRRSKLWLLQSRCIQGVGGVGKLWASWDFQMGNKGQDEQASTRNVVDNVKDNF